MTLPITEAGEKLVELMQERLDTKEFLRGIAIELEGMVRSTVSGGWSTQNVDPMRRMIDRIWVRIGRMT